MQLGDIQGSRPLIISPNALLRSCTPLQTLHLPKRSRMVTRSHSKHPPDIGPQFVASQGVQLAPNVRIRIYAFAYCTSIVIQFVLKLSLVDAPSPYD